MNFYQHPGDSQEIVELAMRAEEFGHQADVAKAAQRKVEERIDELRLAARPTYPTPGHLEGLAEASRRMAELTRPSSHHGDPIGDTGVTVNGERRWLHIRHGAPNGRLGYYLWNFTDEEVQAILDVLKTEHCWRIEDWWYSDGGFSILVSN